MTEIDELRAENERLSARLEAVKAAIPQILAPIEMLRHGRNCTMRQAIYDGARCSCKLQSLIRKEVEAALRAALSVAPQPVEPATCEHGRTGPHPTNPAGHLSQRTCNCPLCPGPAA